MNKERLYHLFAVNDRTGNREQLTRFAMTHRECCVNKSKFSAHPARRIVLAEASAESLDQGSDVAAGHAAT